MRQVDITLEVNYISFCHYIFHLIHCGVRWVEAAESTRHENQELKSKSVLLEWRRWCLCMVVSQALIYRRSARCAIWLKHESLQILSINCDIPAAMAEHVPQCQPGQCTGLDCRVALFVCWFDLYLAISILANTKSCKRKVSETSLSHERPCLGLLCCLLGLLSLLISHLPQDHGSSLPSCLVLYI